MRLSVLAIVKLYSPLYRIQTNGRIVTSTNLTPLNAVLTVTHKKQPFSYDYTLNNAQFKHVAEREGPLNHRGTSTLSWDKDANAIVSKANKLLGLLKRT